MSNSYGSWETFLSIIKRNTSEQSFRTWFSRLEMIDWDGETLKIGVPNKYVLQNLERYYTSIIQQAAMQVLVPDAEKPPRIEAKVKGNLYRKLQADISAQRTTAQATALLQQQSIETQTVRESTGPGYFPTAELSTGAFSAGEYKLETFCAGEANRLALDACREVLGNIRGPYNPLVLYGVSGTGKTHLLRGLCAAVGIRYRNGRILYQSAEAFMNAFTGALRSKTLDAYRERYRTLDVFAIDDLQYLRGKTKTQDEFLCTFEQITARGGLVIAAINTQPEKSGLDGRISDRLLGGLVVELVFPDRKAVDEMLENLAGRRSLLITPEAREALCRKEDMTVRELLGVFNRLAVKAQSSDRVIGLDSVEAELARKTGMPFHVSERPDPDKIIAAVAEHYHITPRSLRSTMRSRKLSLPRKIAAWLIKETCGASLAEIGRRMSGRTTATIHYMLKTLRAKMKTNTALAREIRKIHAKI